MHASGCAAVAARERRLAAGRACWKFPSGVRTACTTCPEPPQVPHVAGVDPALTPLPVQVEQASRRLTSTALLWHAWHMQCQSKCAEGLQC